MLSMALTEVGKRFSSGAWSGLEGDGFNCVSVTLVERPRGFLADKQYIHM